MRRWVVLRVRWMQQAYIILLFSTTINSFTNNRRRMLLHHPLVEPQQQQQCNISCRPTQRVLVTNTTPLHI
jgi:hypothetical protein